MSNGWGLAVVGPLLDAGADPNKARPSTQNLPPPHRQINLKRNHSKIRRRIVAANFDAKQNRALMKARRVIIDEGETRKQTEQKEAGGITCVGEGIEWLVLC